MMTNYQLISLEHISVFYKELLGVDIILSKPGHGYPAPVVDVHPRHVCQYPDVDIQAPALTFNKKVKKCPRPAVLYNTLYVAFTLCNLVVRGPWVKQLTSQNFILKALS